MDIQKIPAGSKKKLYLLPNGMNRPISAAHVKEMASAVRANGILRPVVCIEVDFLEEGGKKLYLADGQHLYIALIKLDLEIPYIIVKGITTPEDVINLIAKMNTTSKSWSLDDYANVWAKNGLKDYNTLIKWKDTLKLGYSTIIMASNPKTMNRSTKSMKKGEFKIVNKSLTETILSNVKDLFGIFQEGYSSEKRIIVESYIRFYVGRTEYNHTKFLNVLRVHTSMLNKYMHNSDTCSSFFEQIYLGGKLNRVMIESKAGSPKAPLS